MQNYADIDNDSGVDSFEISDDSITICTCAYFESFVRQYGLDYAYVNNDFIDFMHSPEGKIILGNAGSLWKTLVTVVPLISKLGYLQERQMDDVWAACKASAQDLILYHPKALGAPDFAEKLGVPCMLAFWQGNRPSSVRFSETNPFGDVTSNTSRV